MSYDCEIVDPRTGETLRGEVHHLRGGVYAIGGTDLAELNVTFNYSPFYPADVLPDGLRTLHGMGAADSAALLERAIAALPDDAPDDDYWRPCPGNARAALRDLLALARMFPDGEWRITG